MPIINPSITIDDLVLYGLLDEGPQNPITTPMPLLPAGRQVQVKAKINLSVLEGEQNYLVYDKNGEDGITHRARIAGGQNEDEISGEDKIEVEIDGR